MRIIIYFMVKLIKICKGMSRVWKSGFYLWMHAASLPGLGYRI